MERWRELQVKSILHIHAESSNIYHTRTMQAQPLWTNCPSKISRGCNLKMWCAINFSEWGYLQMHLMPLYHLLKFMIYVHPHEKLFESHAQIHFLKNIIVCVWFEPFNMYLCENGDSKQTWNCISHLQILHM